MIDYNKKVPICTAGSSAIYDDNTDERWRPFWHLPYTEWRNSRCGSEVGVQGPKVKGNKFSQNPPTSGTQLSFCLSG